MRFLLLAATIAAIPTVAAAQTVANPTTVTPINFNQATYTQDFNTLASTGTTGSALPTGFQTIETGTNANANYMVGDGSDNDGGTYSFGVDGAADRALGTLFSGSNTPSFGAVFTNGLSSAITALTFSFAGEQWRSVLNSPVDRLDFQYRLGGGAINTGTFVDFDNLDILSRVNATTGSVNGNATANRASYNGTIAGLNIGVGQSFAFRFLDFNVSGSDTGLALDDLSITATTNAVTAPVPEAATWAMMVMGFGLMGGALRRRTTRRVAAA